jgi:hypothetical protein
MVGEAVSEGVTPGGQVGCGVSVGKGVSVDVDVYVIVAVAVGIGVFVEVVVEVTVSDGVGLWSTSDMLHPAPVINTIKTNKYNNRRFMRRTLR